MYREEQIIQALAQLKRQRKYPAFPKQILTSLKRPENEKRRLADFLEQMASNKVIRSAKKGKLKGKVYMLAGDDPRYSRVLSAKLKFELLAEIEDLNAKLLELQAAGSLHSATAPSPANVDKRILDSLSRLSSKKKRRVVDIRELRRDLADIPPAALEEALEKLGRDWKIEMQPVQDYTKLSEGQKQGLLVLSDGTKIAAIASADDE